MHIFVNTIEFDCIIQVGMEYIFIEREYEPLCTKFNNVSWVKISVFVGSLVVNRGDDTAALEWEGLIAADVLPTHISRLTLKNGQIYSYIFI